MDKKLITQQDIDAVEKSNLIVFTNAIMDSLKFPNLIACAELKHCELKSVKLPNGCIHLIRLDNCTFEDTAFKQSTFNGSIHISHSNIENLTLPDIVLKDIYLVHCKMDNLELPKIGENLFLLDCDISLTNMSSITCNKFDITKCDLSNKSITCSSRTALIANCELSKTTLTFNVEESIKIQHCTITDSIIECEGDCGYIDFENITFGENVSILFQDKRTKISFTKFDGKQPKIIWQKEKLKDTVTDFVNFLEEHQFKFKNL